MYSKEQAQLIQKGMDHIKKAFQVRLDENGKFHLGMEDHPDLFPDVEDKKDGIYNFVGKMENLGEEHPSAADLDAYLASLPEIEEFNPQKAQRYKAYTTNRLNEELTKREREKQGRSLYESTEDQEKRILNNREDIRYKESELQENQNKAVKIQSELDEGILTLSPYKKLQEARIMDHHLNDKMGQFNKTIDLLMKKEKTLEKAAEKAKMAQKIKEKKAELAKLYDAYDKNQDEINEYEKRLGGTEETQEKELHQLEEKQSQRNASLFAVNREIKRLTEEIKDSQEKLAIAENDLAKEQKMEKMQEERIAIIQKRLNDDQFDADKIKMAMFFRMSQIQKAIQEKDYNIKAPERVRIHNPEIATSLAEEIKKAANNQIKQVTWMLYNNEKVWEKENIEIVKGIDTKETNKNGWKEETILYDKVLFRNADENTRKIITAMHSALNSARTIQNGETFDSYMGRIKKDTLNRLRELSMKARQNGEKDPRELVEQFFNANREDLVDPGKAMAERLAKENKKRNDLEKLPRLNRLLEECKKAQQELTLAAKEATKGKAELFGDSKEEEQLKTVNEKIAKWLGKDLEGLHLPEKEGNHNQEVKKLDEYQVHQKLQQLVAEKEAEVQDEIYKIHEIKREAIPRMMLKTLQNERKILSLLAYRAIPKGMMEKAQETEIEIKNNQKPKELSQINGRYPLDGYTQMAKAQLDAYATVIEAYQMSITPQKYWKIDETINDFRNREDTIQLMAKELERVKARLGEKVQFVMKDDEKIEDYINRIHRYVLQETQNNATARARIREEDIKSIAAKMSTGKSIDPEIRTAVEHLIPKCRTDDFISLDQINNFDLRKKDPIRNEMRKNREELQKIMASSHPKPFAKESKIYTYENFVYEMAQKEFTIHEARERLKELYAQNITISQKDIEKIKELKDIFLFNTRERKLKEYHKSEYEKFIEKRNEVLSADYKMKESFGKAQDLTSKDAFNAGNPDDEIDHRQDGKERQSKNETGEKNQLDTQAFWKANLKWAAMPLNAEETKDMIDILAQRDAILQRSQKAEAALQNNIKAGENNYTRIDQLIGRVQIMISQNGAKSRAIQFHEENNDKTVAKARTELLNDLKKVRAQYKDRPEEIPTKEELLQMKDLAGKKTEKLTQGEIALVNKVKAFPMTAEKLTKALETEEQYQNSVKVGYAARWIKTMTEINNINRAEYTMIKELLQENTPDREEKIAKQRILFEKERETIKRERLTQYKGEFVSGKKLRELEADPEKAIKLKSYPMDLLLMHDPKFVEIQKSIEENNEKLMKTGEKLTALQKEAEAAREEIRTSPEKAAILEVAKKARDRLIKASIPKCIEKIEEKFLADTNNRNVDNEEIMQEGLRMLTEAAEKTKVSTLVNAMSRHGKEYGLSDALADKVNDSMGTWLDQQRYNNTPSKTETKEIKLMRSIQNELGQTNNPAGLTESERIAMRMSEEKAKVNHRTFGRALNNLEKYETQKRDIMNQAQIHGDEKAEEKIKKINAYQTELQKEYQRKAQKLNEAIGNAEKKLKMDLSKETAPSLKVDILLNRFNVEEKKKTLWRTANQSIPQEYKELKKAQADFKENEKAIKQTIIIKEEIEKNIPTLPIPACIKESQILDQADIWMQRKIKNAANIMHSDEKTEKAEKMSDWKEHHAKSDIQAITAEALINNWKKRNSQNMQGILETMTPDQKKTVLTGYLKSAKEEKLTANTKETITQMLETIQEEGIGKRQNRMIDTVINMDKESYLTVVETAKENKPIEDRNQEIRNLNEEIVKKNQTIADSLKQSDPEIKKAVETIEKVATRTSGGQGIQSTRDTRMQNEAAKEYNQAIETINQRLIAKGKDLIKNDTIQLEEALQIKTVKEMATPKPYENATPEKARQILIDTEIESKRNPEMTPETYYESMDNLLLKSSKTKNGIDLDNLMDLTEREEQTSELWKESYQDYTAEKVDQLKMLEQTGNIQSLDQSISSMNSNSNDRESEAGMINQQSKTGFEESLKGNDNDISDTVIQEGRRNITEDFTQNLHTYIMGLESTQRKVMVIELENINASSRMKASDFYQEPMEKITEEQIEDYEKIREAAFSDVRSMLEVNGYVSTKQYKERKEEKENEKAIEELSKGKEPEKIAKEMLNKDSRYKECKKFSEKLQEKQEKQMREETKQNGIDR